MFCTENGIVISVLDCSPIEGRVATILQNATDKIFRKRSSFFILVSKCS